MCLILIEVLIDIRYTFLFHHEKHWRRFTLFLTCCTNMLYYTIAYKSKVYCVTPQKNHISTIITPRQTDKTHTDQPRWNTMICFNHEQAWINFFILMGLLVLSKENHKKFISHGIIQSSTTILHFDWICVLILVDFVLNFDYICV